MRVLIATGGSCHATEAFRRAILDWDPELVIAADSGLRHLLAMQIRPHLLLGDMDSVDPALLVQAQEMGLEPRVFPSHKDETDTELALSIALEEAGADAEIRIIGGTGSRVDHTYANLHLLNRYYCQAELWDGDSRIWILQGPVVETVEKPRWFSADKTAYVSFLPFGTPVTEVSLEGFEYPLDRYDMDVNAVIGTSNQLREHQGQISFSNGIMLCSIVQE
ncbi:MAG: thiamine diphosphokinase [Firmicutes bacterium]|nr:thiamine diphosphokinase [Bacillota bacterium]